MHSHEHEAQEADLFPELLHGERGTGWNFGVGHPEFWQQSQRLVIPGGRVLDMGAQLVNRSLFFALSGMSVDAYDNNPEIAAAIREIATNRALPFRVFEEDLQTAQIEQSAYDMVVIGDIISHLQSKERGYEIVDKAITAIKPGGHIWLQAAGKDSSDYHKLSRGAEAGYIFEGYNQSGYDTSDLVSTDTFAVTCYHGWQHGDHVDYRAFYEQNELLFYFIANDLKIISAETTPSIEVPNFKYGKDWPTPMLLNGFITLLAQKP